MCWLAGRPGDGLTEWRSRGLYAALRFSGAAFVPDASNEPDVLWRRLNCFLIRSQALARLAFAIFCAMCKSNF